MSDIELVIKIPKEDYEIMKHNIEVDNPLCPLSQKDIVAAIANGTPLPKGHERLIDAGYEVSSDGRTIDTVCGYMAPTIIEADKDGDIE